MNEWKETRHNIYLGFGLDRISIHTNLIYRFLTEFDSFGQYQFIAYFNRNPSLIRTIENIPKPL